MTDYIRRIVSGQKARFKDGKVELDLVYITDRVIIMGYPASGVEGMYRNRREDAKKFLESRHGKNFWVFNLCPVKENSYPSSFFDGRVSRYPFPDHHAPPLAIMPLIAREIRAWLSGSPDRVVVLHCKAGKGRSGTMACSYLLANDEEATAPRLERSYTAKEWAALRADQFMTVIPNDIDDPKTGGLNAVPETMIDGEITTSPTATSPISSLAPSRAVTAVPSSTAPSKTESLKTVLDLHTSRRMKAPSPDKKLKQGVSIPSQRRWLYYWALILANDAPKHLWNAPPPSLTAPDLSSAVQLRRDGPKVRLLHITLRMKETSGVTKNIVRAANAILDRTSLGKVGSVLAKENGHAHVWISLARYDDEFVDVLERWERYTRDNESMGKRRPGSDHIHDASLTDMFKSDKWDKGKMVRSFARLGATDATAISTQGEDDDRITTYTLRPLSQVNWDNLKDEIQPEDTVPAGQDEMPEAESQSINDVTRAVTDRGVVLDAGREVRAKLYMGQVFMGWLWFIPTFHMGQPAPGAGEPQPPRTTLKLTRKELDFPLGLGSSIIDVEIALEWLKAADNEVVQPAARTDSVEEGLGGEPAGAAAALEAVAKGNVGDAVHAAQGAEN